MNINDKVAADAGHQIFSVTVLYCVCGILLISILLFDLAIPSGISVGVLYILVVLLSLLLPNDKATVIFAIISSILIITAVFCKPEVDEMWKVAHNRVIALFTVWAIALLGLRRKKWELQRILELQETQTRYLHAEKLSAIGKLTASIAHELNNPLQSVMAILKSMQGKTRLEGEDGNLLELAMSEIQRMKNLIRNLLDFNRPSSGDKVFVNVHDCCDHVLLLCKTHFRHKKIAIELNYVEELPPILAVPDQIKQVLFNLLNNAADAMENGGVITIITSHDKKMVTVAIKDTGVGIEPGIVDKIFEPFFSTKAVTKGTGLGLSVCRDIVQSHHGKIGVKSHPGEGTIFTVFLPKARA